MTSTIAKVTGKMYLCTKIIWYGIKKKNNGDIERVEGQTEPFATCYNGYPPMR